MSIPPKIVVPVSNLEIINKYFKLPISYNSKIQELNPNIIKDLELINTIEPENNPIYQYIFQPNTCFGKKVMEQMPLLYTTDTVFLKDTQQLLKKYKRPEENLIFTYDCEPILKIWDEIKNDTGFKEKYHYIDWPYWEYLNKSEQFLEVMSIYNLAAPVMSLFIPVIILIIPFFIIKMKGLDITVAEYTDILHTIASNHAIGKLFTQFNSVPLDEKLYLLASALFYVFSIYQNILICIKFNQNMIKIHEHLNEIRLYIEHTERTMENLMGYTGNLKAYAKFNEEVIKNREVLTEFKDKLNTIGPYKFNFTKMGELGVVLKCFYDIYNNDIYNNAFLYSFGFHGYIDNIEGLVSNIKNKDIHFARFTSKMRKGKMVNAYYPTLIHNSPVKNTYKFSKNMVITGPNASGKTTVLKSALINTIITQQMGCGFYDSAKICPYKYIHCYLNIPDTSGRDSLFQAEARRCKDIIDIINDGNNKKDTHFCVFDELYSGTNPEEAVMSAFAFMKYLIKFKNVNCILTTHFIDLCKHLERTNGPNIENCHMHTEKKGESFEYKYILKRGISDVRGGFKVLEDMNYPREIIDDTSNKQ